MPAFTPLDAPSDGVLAKGLVSAKKLLENPSSLPEACLLDDALPRSSAELPLCDTLTHSQLKRALLRWHAANLEYGLAGSMGEVSLSSWDQDDAFNTYGENTRHAFIKDGYDTHVRGLCAGVPIVYGAEVKTVEWGGEGEGEGGSASASASAPSAGARLHIVPAGAAPASTPTTIPLDADAVIVTVPLGVLQESRPHFSPPLPQWKTSAIQALGSGLLNKVCLKFPHAFWRKDGNVAVEAAGVIGAPTPALQAAPSSDADSAAAPVPAPAATDKGEKEDMAAEAPPPAAAPSSALVATTPGSSSSSSSSSSSAPPPPRPQPPPRLITHVPFLPSQFHFNPKALNDAQLLSACAVALAAAKSAAGGSGGGAAAWRSGATPTLWDACLAAGEASDLAGTAELVRAWYGEEGHGAAGGASAASAASGLMIEDSGGGGGGADAVVVAATGAKPVGQSLAEEDAARIFALPPLPLRGTYHYNPLLVTPPPPPTSSSGSGDNSLAASGAGGAPPPVDAAGSEEERALARAAAAARTPPPPPQRPPTPHR